VGLIGGIEHEAERYCRYYLHLTPPAETNRQPQIASIWMLIFFFGSVVRYATAGVCNDDPRTLRGVDQRLRRRAPKQLLFMARQRNSPPRGRLAQRSF